MMMLRQLLLLLVAVNIPTCWSVCDLSAARRDAQTGSCHVINPKARLPMARRAAKRANVKLNNVEEAYRMVRRRVTLSSLIGLRNQRL